MPPTEYDPYAPHGVDAPSEPPETVEIPAGTMEERLVWIAEGADYDEKSSRANAVYSHERAAGASTEELEDLGAQLRTAVYGDGSDDADNDENDENADPDENTDPQPPGQAEPEPVPAPESEQPVETEQPAEEEPVPSGGAADVEQWVDGDKERAQRALDVETGENGQNRKGLTAYLKSVLETE